MSTLHNRGPPAAWQGPNALEIKSHSKHKPSVTHPPRESVTYPPGRSMRSCLVDCHSEKRLASSCGAMVNEKTSIPPS